MTKIQLTRLSDLLIQKKQLLKLKQKQAIEEKNRQLEERLDNIIRKQAKEIMHSRQFPLFTKVNSDTFETSITKTVQEYATKASMNESEWAPWSICYKKH